ncbi:MAG TPA: hypothetical protein VF188_05710 [Longimicrobiales bacterium]
MARYDTGYDRSFGLGYRRTGRRAYGTSPRYATYGPEPRERVRRGAYYESEYPRRGRERERYAPRDIEYGREYMGYGPDYGYGIEYGGRGYGAEFRKSRWETDYGDPFRDRGRGTPIRVLRGAYGEYGEEYARRRQPRRGYEFEFRPRRRR